MHLLFPPRAQSGTDAALQPGVPTHAPAPVPVPVPVSVSVLSHASALEPSSNAKAVSKAASKTRTKWKRTTGMAAPPRSKAVSKMINESAAMGMGARTHANIIDMTHPEIAGLSDSQLSVLRAVAERSNVFVSGRAGSGKSKVIHVLVEALRSANTSVVVTAASGLAAGQVNGVTLHSLCCMGIDDKKETRVCAASVIKKHGAMIKGLQVLIIDEVSMLSAETLKQALSIIGWVRDPLPIIVLVGDFCQLPPAGKGTLALESQVWRELKLEVVLLTSSFRQADATFVRLLDEARVGSLSNASIKALQTRVGVVFDGDVRPTMLTPLRSLADAINVKELAKLTTERHEFRARVFLGTYDFTEKTWRPAAGTDRQPTLVRRTGSSEGTSATASASAGAGAGAGSKSGTPWNPYAALDGAHVTLPDRDPQAWQNACALVTGCRQAVVLTMATGAQVMFTANVDPPRIVNGSRGVVRGFSDGVGTLGYPIVELVSGEAVTVVPFACTAAASKAGSSYVYLQFPLGPAWAMTIHKSQGMSIDLAEINLGSTLFSPGQAYVALSRLRTFNGLGITEFSEAAVRAVKVNPHVLEWYKRQEARLLSSEVDKDIDIGIDDDIDPGGDDHEHGGDDGDHEGDFRDRARGDV